MGKDILTEYEANFRKVVEGLGSEDRIILGYEQTYSLEDLNGLKAMAEADSHIIEHNGDKYFIGRLTISNGDQIGRFHNEDCVSRITFDQYLNSTDGSYSVAKGYLHKLTDTIVMEREYSHIRLDEDFD